MFKLQLKTVPFLPTKYDSKLKERNLGFIMLEISHITRK